VGRLPRPGEVLTAVSTRACLAERPFPLVEAFVDDRIEHHQLIDVAVTERGKFPSLSAPNEYRRVRGVSPVWGPGEDLPSQWMIR
jgi:hypothetical protein